MSQDNTNNQHVQNVQTNVVQCHFCNHKHIVEQNMNALESALKIGWKHNGINGKSACKFCSCPQHAFNSPYYSGDDRKSDSGWFMDFKTDDGNIDVLKLNFNTYPPLWEFHKKIEGFYEK